jgi:hypothetical protein|tara:strand:- start:193 stop:507 length:315 start_codon:yes stop_codon:yes gene_type:complete
VASIKVGVKLALFFRNTPLFHPHYTFQRRLGQSEWQLLPLRNLCNMAVCIKVCINNISDISVLASLNNLQRLGLEANNISDILSLIENSSFSTRDIVNLIHNIP